MIYPKRNYDNIFSEKTVNELYDWIDKYPHVIQSLNVSDSSFVKINVTIIKKQKNLLQISVRDLQNDLILPTYQGGFFGALNVYGKLFIGDKSLRKYTQNKNNQRAT